MAEAAYWATSRRMRWTHPVHWPQVGDDGDDAPAVLTLEQAHELACGAAIHMGQERWHDYADGVMTLADVRRREDEERRWREDWEQRWRQWRAGHPPKDMPVLAIDLAWQAHAQVMRELGLA